MLPVYGWNRSRRVVIRHAAVNLNDFQMLDAGLVEILSYRDGTWVRTAYEINND